MGYSLEEIADRLEINDVIARYVHALDARDFDALDDVFVPDTIFDFTADGNGFRDWTFMKAYFVKHHHIPHDHHIYANVLIMFNEDRSRATTVSKVYNPQGQRDADGAVHLFHQFGDYHDEWARTEAGWRITARRWAFGWVDGDYPFTVRLGAKLPQPGEL